MNHAVYTGPDEQQLAHYHEHGYFIARGVLDRDEAMEVRGVIKDHVQRPESEASGDQADPMDPMADDTPAARAARFRKLSGLGLSSPVVWHTIFANPTVLGLARHFLGEDILLKYDSCFLKPAKTGSATPWHQDNGLWRDGETQPFNFWIAIDPATQENGCLQMIPGTHHEPITEHVMYPEGVHAELPHESVKAMSEKYGGPRHIELDSGDAVCWHSSLYHYSPPNGSPKNRIAVAGVYTTPELADQHQRLKKFHWVMRNGEVSGEFPPKAHHVAGEPIQLPPSPAAAVPV